MAGLNAGICAFGALFPKGRWSTEEVVRFLSAAGPDVHNILDREVPLLFSVRDLPSDRLGDCLAPAWRCLAHEHMFGIRVVALAEKMKTACLKCGPATCAQKWPWQPGKSEHPGSKNVPKMSPHCGTKMGSYFVPLQFCFNGGRPAGPNRARYVCSFWGRFLDPPWPISEDHLDGRSLGDSSA